MYRKMKNQVKDERIEKESNRIMPAIFYLFSAGLVLSLAAKLVLGEPWYNFILELLCLIPAWGYAIVKRAQSGILFIKEKDEALLTIRNGIMAKAFTISFWMILVGELIYMFFVVGVLKVTDEVWSRELTWMILYLAVWFLPAVIVTVLTIKKGWMVWGSKKREAVGKKNFAKRTAIGALLFGAMMGVMELLENGFSEKVILVTLVCGAFCGIMFYFLMTLLIKISEKNADREVEEKEEKNEE